jgi:hypothetical protein
VNVLTALGGDPGGNMKRVALMACASILLVGCGRDVSFTNGDWLFEGIEHWTEDPAMVLTSFRLADANTLESAPYLDRTHFIIAEDGDELQEELEEQVRVVQRGKAFEIETVVMLDFSGSIINSGQLPDLLGAARSFVDEVDGLTNLEIRYFDGSEETTPMHVFADATPPKRSINAFEDHQPGDSSTNLNGAVVAGLEILDRRRRQATNSNLYADILVVFTDGTHQAGEGGAYPTADQATTKVNQSPHAVYSIGVEGRVDPSWTDEDAKPPTLICMPIFWSCSRMERTKPAKGVRTRLQTKQQRK